MNRRRHVTQLACVLPLTALFACAASTEPVAGTTSSADGAAATNASSDGATHQPLLATLKVDAAHSLSFYGLGDGTTMVLEDGLEGVAPVLPKNVSQLSLADVYRMFAPSGGEVPAEITEADARHADAMTSAGPIALHPKPEATTTPDGAPSEGASSAPPSTRFHTETVADNNWFSANFCNGAQACYFGTGYLWTESNSNVTYGYVAAENGSEATANATLDFWYYGSCVCTNQVLWYCGSWACKWTPVGGGQYTIVPGHWISTSVTEGSGTQFYWQLFGGSQQMGIATRWH